MSPPWRTPVLLISGAVLLVGCSTLAPGRVDPTTLQAIRAAVDRIDGTAGGPVDAQRAVLTQLADPGQQQAQAGCATATSTLSFEPVWADLQPDPTWQPSVGTMTGQVWSVPTVVRVHLGSRIDATDLANLHFSLVDGVARTSALCVT